MESIIYYNQPMWLHDPNGVKYPYGETIGQEVIEFLIYMVQRTCCHRV
jgi:hypothetical protein